MSQKAVKSLSHCSLDVSVPGAVRLVVTDPAGLTTSVNLSAVPGNRHDKQVLNGWIASNTEQKKDAAPAAPAPAPAAAPVAAVPEGGAS